MSKKIALELLQKVSNPSHSFTDFEPDDDGAMPNVPHRIASRLTAKPNSKKQPILNQGIELEDPVNNLYENIPRHWDIMDMSNVQHVQNCDNIDYKKDYQDGTINNPKENMYDYRCVCLGHLKRPWVPRISATDMCIISLRSLLQYINEELIQRGQFDHTLIMQEDNLSQLATLPMGEALEPSSHNYDRIKNHCSYPGSLTSLECSPRRRRSSLEEIVPLTDLLTINGEPRHRSFSDSSSKGRDSENNEDEIDPLSTPPVPPRRKERRRHTPPRPISNGLPPTPKVHMGACFSKVFNGCPLRIHCTASWIHPDTRDQHILIGAEEGIYNLNLNELHETAMDQLYPRRTIWLYVIKDVLMSLSGKTTQLYRHDLLAMHSKQNHRFTLHVNKMPERLVPRKFALTTKVPDTKGCTRCCVTRNPYNGYKYLCGSLSSGIFLMQWYDPLNKFMLLKHFECSLPSQSSVFEMIITPEVEYPMVCISVKHGYQDSRLKLELINMNTGANWFHSDELEEMDGNTTIIPRREPVNVTTITQLDKDSVLVCYDNIVKIITPHGKIRSSRRQLSELQFDFHIESIVCLPDSILAFHKHGVQGRSLKNGEITQEIGDSSRSYRLLGSDKVVVLEAHTIVKVGGTLTGEDGADLYILAGHEASY